MLDPLPLWRLGGFEDLLSQWVERDRPDPEVVAAVAEWIPTRRIDPFGGTGLRREQLVGGELYWMKIPGTSNGRRVAFCSFLIRPEQRLVLCTQIDWTDA